MFIQMLKERYSDCRRNFARLQELIQGPDQEIRNWREFWRSRFKVGLKIFFIREVNHRKITCPTGVKEQIVWKMLWRSDSNRLIRSYYLQKYARRSNRTCLSAFVASHQEGTVLLKALIKSLISKLIVQLKLIFCVWR